LYFSGESDEYFQLTPRVVQIGSTVPIEVDYNFWLENKRGRKFAETAVQKELFDDNGFGKGFDQFMSCEYFDSKKDLFEDNVVIVCCKICRYLSNESLPDVDSSLRQKLWKSYRDGLVDVFTIQVEQKEFKVSKMILAAHSAVFKKMFATVECNEAQTGKILIKDTKADVMEALIEFMHLGTLEVPDEIASDLLILADKYEVQELKCLCADTIGEGLTSDTFFDSIVLAYLHKSDKLKKHVLEFIAINSDGGIFTSLLLSDEWFRFATEHGELAKEIGKDVFSKLNFNC